MWVALPAEALPELEDVAGPPGDFACAEAFGWQVARLRRTSSRALRRSGSFSIVLFELPDGKLLDATCYTNGVQPVSDSYAFAVDVFRTVCERLASKAVDLRLMVETTSSFEEWLNWEAFLACKHREVSYPFCEVASKPTYASEGVADDGGGPDRGVGDLRVGGPNEGADHCWVFAAFALLHDGNRTGGEWLRKIEANADKLRRLGWKKSSSLLVVVAASRGDVTTEGTNDLAGSAVWNRAALTDPCVISLPGGGTVVLKAFDIKRDPADTLAATIC